MLTRATRLVSSLTLIILVSVVLRVGSALFLGGEVVTLPGTADQVSYHTLALRVISGEGFTFGEAWWPATRAGEPTAHWSYLYTIYLTLIYSVFGPAPLAARIFQAVIVGALQPYLAYRLAQAAFGEFPGVGKRTSARIPVLAAWITAIYFYFIYYAVTLMTEAFFITAVLGVFLIAIRLGEKIDENMYWKNAIWLGIAVTAAVLLRQLFLLFVPFILLWLLLVSKKKHALRQALTASAITLSVLLAGILPFTYYNYTRFHRFVLLNTNAGYVLFWANHPIHGTSFIPASEMGETYQKLIPAELRSLDEAALDQALLKEGVKFILAEPGRYVLLSLSRILPYFKFWPDKDSGMISNLARVGSFGLFLPFMVYGLLRLFSYLRQAAVNRREYLIYSPAALLYLFLIVYSVIHVLTWTLVRYRLPVDAILVLFSALAIAGFDQDFARLFRQPGRLRQRRADT